LVQELETLGGHVMCSSSRENILYSATLFRHDIPKMLNILADTVQNACVTEDEMIEARDSLEFDLMNMAQKPEMLLSELTHQAAYQLKGLGNPLMCPRENVEKLTRDMVLDYRKRYFVSDRILIAGAGIRHQDLVALVNDNFRFLQPSNSECRARLPGQYYGGFVFVEEPSQKFTHVSLGFEGVSVHHPDFYTFAILQILMGGGSSFSAGGPGKGMYSRIFLNILNQYHWAESALSYNLSYIDSGLFGISGASIPNQADSLLRVFAYELLKMSENIDVLEFNRAKNQLKSSLMMNLEQVGMQCEDIARQTLTFGKRYRPFELCEFIDRVTVNDTQQAARRMLQGKPSLAAYGNLSRISQLEDVAKAFFS
jgi:processing peptidase subunit alpha